MPERSSSAGDSSDPQATTTRRCLHRDLGLPSVRRLPDRLDPGRAAILGEHAHRPGEGEETGAVLLRVGEPGPVGALLAAGLIAESEIAGRLRRVAAGIGVAHDRLEAPAERLGPLPQPLLRPVQVAARNRSR